MQILDLADIRRGSGCRDESLLGMLMRWMEQWAAFESKYLSRYGVNGMERRPLALKWNIVSMTISHWCSYYDPG